MSMYKFILYMYMPFSIQGIMIPDEHFWFRKGCFNPQDVLNEASEAATPQRADGALEAGGGLELVERLGDGWFNKI